MAAIDSRVQSLIEPRSRGNGAINGLFNFPSFGLGRGLGLQAIVDSPRKSPATFRAGRDDDELHPTASRWQPGRPLLLPPAGSACWRGRVETLCAEARNWRPAYELPISATFKTILAGRHLE
jgi:hypothetical protein